MTRPARLLMPLTCAAACLAANAQTTPESAAAAAATPVAAAARVGPYVVAAIGRADYDYDCFVLFGCEDARATSGKLGFGYRFGVFGVEAWVADYGKTNTSDSNGTLRLRSAGVSAVWTLRFGESFEGSIRAGGADVRHQRHYHGQTYSSSKFQPTFGLALDFLMTPQLALELGWDVTRSETVNVGTVVVNAASLGLRVRF